MKTQRLSDEEVRDLAASARDMLDSPVFQMAITELHARYVETLEQSDLGSPEAMMAHAGLKLVSTFASSLQAMITEQTMRVRYPHKDRENG